MNPDIHEKTDELRRLALQLAIQLPENVTDARRVLVMTSECLDKFLIDPGGRLTPLQRARRLGWRVDLAEPEDLPAPEVLAPAPGPTIGWTLASLVISVPLSAMLWHTIGHGAYLTFGFFVIAIAMTFGAWPGLLLAAVSAIANNLLVLPPALEFTPPSRLELVCAVFYVVFALLMPPLTRRIKLLRQLAARSPG